MKWTDHADKPCSIAKTLGVIGDSWTLLILRNCFLGVRRFDDFQQQLGLTRHLLTDRLKKLVEHQVLKKVPYGERAGRYEYILTEKGLDLYPIIMAMANWGNRWMFDEGDAPLLYRHKLCGQITTPTTSCSQCGETIAPHDIEVIPGSELNRLAVELGEDELTEAIGFRVPTL